MPDPIALLSELIAAGRDGEAAVQRVVAAHLTALGCAVESFVYRPEEVTLREEFAGDRAIVAGARSAVIARLTGTGGGRSCVLFAHPDSEPVPANHGWSADPFRARIADGRLHGWGVADDLSGVAAMISGLGAALGEGWRPRGEIVIASTPSKRHARGAAAVLQHIARPDAALYLHPAESGAGMGEIKACTPGLLEFRIALAGRAPDTQEPGHAAFAHRGLNVADAAAALLAALSALDAARGGRVAHPRIAGFAGRATNVLVSSLRFGAEGARNRLPVDGVIEGSISFPPGESLASVMAELRAAVAAAPLPAGWPEALHPRIDFPAGVSGAETGADHPLFVCVEAAIRAETGAGAFVNPVHTASDIRVPIVQQGVPTLGLGPLGGDLTQNGRVDEWVDVEDHRRCVAVVARALRAWCG
ncbi:MAG: M20/M25/M40 family metallo-hydrolase [Methylobacteriaceae bacterium]|nr:M20/M25/M40 family metallo-hydrolase [Methylobacteriaceae bacterium]